MMIGETTEKKIPYFRVVGPTQTKESLHEPGCY